MKSLLLILFIPLVSHAALEAEDLNYRKELAEHARTMIASVSNAPNDANKIGETEKLKSWIESEKTEALKNLETAKKKKPAPRNFTELDARANEALLIFHSFDTVFERALSSAFAKNAEFKRKACDDFENDVLFNDMAGLPDGSPRPVSTDLSLSLAKALCSSPSPK